MDGYITRVADEIADILLREGIDYVQSKAVFKAARSKAGLRAPKERRAAPARLTLKEQLRFIDAAYARSGQTGLMVQILLETGTRVGYSFVPGDLHPLPSASSPGAPDFGTPPNAQRRQWRAWLANPSVAQGTSARVHAQDSINVRLDGLHSSHLSDALGGKAPTQ